MADFAAALGLLLVIEGVLYAAFPEGMKRGVYYQPVERGYERELKKRLDYFVKLRAKRHDG